MKASKQIKADFEETRLFQRVPTKEHFFMKTVFSVVRKKKADFDENRSFQWFAKKEADFKENRRFQGFENNAPPDEQTCEKVEI